ncbi:salt tolerance down-regulator-domain-containing protein [Chlamydoabsidia padenii]|nr:salt tolerance down-regulator-domain-containing protein [Chlamydoabsidia padenii]
MASASNSIGTKTMNISLDNKRKPQPQKTTQLDTKSNRSPVNSIPTLTHDQPHSGGIFVASSYISVKVPDGLSPVTTSRSIESSTCGTNNNTATENDGVWSSNDSADERLKLREFWQQLDQDYKEKLLMMEREDLLLKMNNHRRHGSHCFLCGKKRMIIEKEIKNVYEIYCNELDRSRNQQQPQSTSTCVANTQDTSCTRSHHHLLGTEKTDPQHNQDKPIVDTPHHDTSSLPDSKKAPLDMLTYFHLRNGITLKNDMLTVSDELLKNNGEPLMHMMDLLAEQRLDELRYSKEQENGDDKQMDDMCDEYRDYDNEDNEYACDSPHAEEEEDHVDININIFKIFVAKLFEQRVLFAYREKVAQKRQEQLLQELDKEDQCQKEQSLKKQRDIEKKKERKR